MKRSLYPSHAVCVLSLFVAGVLCGCGGNFNNLPSVGGTGDVKQVPLGNLRGSNFGGHAPIAGAHAFVFQVGTGGYGSKVTSLLSANYANGNVTQQDTFGTATTNPTYGLYYVVTDEAGGFNITGDYTCTAGYPVFLFADGGVTQYPALSDTFGISQVVVSDVTGTGMAQTATMTFTTTTTELFYVGETVVLSGFGGTWVSLNGASVSVLSSNLTTTTFAATGVSTNSGLIVAGTYATPGTATAFAQGNYAIDNMALLGNCPSSGTFAGTINYVYMNEVSTAAAAYALAGFADTSVNNDALHIGIPSGDPLALQAIQNAALTANNLYDIQGGNVGTASNGEDHIARSSTPNGGLGSVPQLLMDTIGNILAACVDSNNLYDREYGLGTFSPQCSTLFQNATGDGTPTGTQPFDIATAAINLAHHPAGVGNPNFVSNLFNMPVGNIPFAPNLASAPKDFTVGITYSGTGLALPVDVAIDGGGNAWVTSAAGYVTEVTPSAALGTNSPIAVVTPSYVSIDPSGNIWTTSGTGNAVYEMTSTGTPVTGSPYQDNGILGGPAGIAQDGAGHTYVAASSGYAGLLALLDPAGSLFKISGTGPTATFGNFSDTLLYLGTLYNYLPNPSQVAVDANGHVWVSGDGTGLLGTGNNVARIRGSDGFVDFNYPGCPILNLCSPLTDPEGIAIDSGGNGWAAYNSATPTLVKITSTGAATKYTGGGLNGPFGVAIDGAGTVWVANQTGNSLSKFTSAGVAETGTSGYSGGGFTAPTNLAVDLSGNVWVVNSAGNSVTELIGAATPVMTPLSAAVAAGTTAARP